MSNDQVAARSVSSLVGENKVLLWDSSSGSSGAVEGLTIQQVAVNGNAAILVFRFDARLWKAPVCDREVRVVVERGKTEPQYPFLRQSAVREQGCFFLQLSVCLGKSPTRVIARKASTELQERDAQRRRGRELWAPRSMRERTPRLTFS